LNIRQINPTGNNSINNLDYFKTTEWMNQELIDSLDAYDILYASKQTNYSTLLLSYKTRNSELLTLYTELALLQNGLGGLTELVTIQRQQIQANTSISLTNGLIMAKQAEIAAKNSLIFNKNAQLDSIIDSLNVIVEALSLENNFSPQQIKDLDKLTITYTYQNEAFIITDSMTEGEKQEQAELLLSDGYDILARLSQPRFSFTIDSVDFLKIPDFLEFIRQFELASSVYIELEPNVVVEARIISYSRDWDANTLSIQFTSKYRVTDPSYTYNELYAKSVSAGISVSFSKYAYSDWQRNSKDDVTLFMKSALDATLNKIISSTLEEVITDGNGTRYRQSDGDGFYELEQMWAIHNMLAFTDDGWDTAKMALGRINFDGVDVFGLVGEVIVGNIIAGNELRISNSANNFILDNSGATLTDASFTLTTTDNKARIILDPATGIKIQGNSTGSFINKFYVDTNGNAIFSGTLSGANGSFSGTVSASNIIGSTVAGASIVGGQLNINDRFLVNSLGNMSATNASISGTISSSTISSSTITGSIINGAVINGGTINVDTNMTIGNTLYLGSQDNTETKEVAWSSGTRITGGSDGMLPWLFISTSELTIGDKVHIPSGLLNIGQSGSEVFKTTFSGGQLNGYWSYNGVEIGSASGTAVWG